jgi:hypothetical protein
VNGVSREESDTGSARFSERDLGGVWRHVSGLGVKRQREVRLPNFRVGRTAGQERQVGTLLAPASFSARNRRVLSDMSKGESMGTRRVLVPTDGSAMRITPTHQHHHCGVMR